MDYAEIQWIGLYSQHLAQGLEHGDSQQCVLNRCLDLIKVAEGG